MPPKRHLLRRLAGIFAIIPLQYLLLVTGTASVTIMIVKRTNQVIVDRFEAIAAKLNTIR